MRSRDVAEEIVQEVFLGLWRDRRRWHLRTTARAWLYTAVRHQALNHVRHERVVAQFRDRVGVAPGATATDHAGDGESGGAAHGGLGGGAPDPHAALEARELDERVDRALALLPERRRVAMLLRWKHDLSAGEIARVLDTTPDSVRVLLSRARRDLAALLGR